MIIKRPCSAVGANKISNAVKSKIREDEKKKFKKICFMDLETPTCMAQLNHVPIVIAI